MNKLDEIARKQDEILQNQLEQSQKVDKIHDANAGDEYRKGMRQELDELHEHSGSRWRNTKIGAILVVLYEALQNIIQHN